MRTPHTPALAETAFPSTSIAAAGCLEVRGEANGFGSLTLIHRRRRSYDVEMRPSALSNASPVG
jgi:hypothetical protein